MSSNGDKINELIEDVVAWRKLVPKSVETMDELSKKYYQKWKFKIDKITIDKKCEDIQYYDSLQANTHNVISTKELKQNMKTTFKVLEIMLENQKSPTAQIIDKT